MDFGLAPFFFARRAPVYKVSTRAGNARAAMEQLKRFEADPEGYNPAGVPHEAPIYLDAPLAEEFLVWNRDMKKNSREWLEKQQRYLAWWADQLKGLDLRKLSLVDHIKPALKGAGNGLHRIAVLKSVYSWLRKEKHLLTMNEDPTFQTLVVPQARPEQWKRDKVIPREHYLLAREHLAPYWRDGMDVQAGTGWHVTELIRFAKEGWRPARRSFHPARPQVRIQLPAHPFLERLDLLGRGGRIREVVTRDLFK